MSDDKKQSDSDRALARLLPEALRPPDGAGSDSACPDAGLLATYAERNLDNTEASHWEEHFAGCARCQRILAVLAVSGEEPLDEAEVERFGRKLSEAAMGVAGRETPVGERKQVTPFSRPRTAWRWLAPAVGIAAAAALWIALRPAPPRGTPANIAQKAIAQPSAAPNESLEAKADVPAPPAAAPREAEPQTLDKQRLKSPVLIQPQEKKIDEAAGAAAVPQPSAAQADNAVAAPQGAGALQGPTAKESAANEPQARSREESPAAAPVAPPPAPAPAPAAAAAPAAPTADAAANRAPEAKANENRALQTFASRDAIAGLASRAPLVLASPNRSVLWRLDPAGRIERSADQGRNWQEQASGVTSDLLAGAAPSDTVAWIAGRAGVILRTTDGEHWQRVPSPDAAADWTAISASDALHAAVTSADRRRFATEDGGQTWKPQ